ncbi:MAG TPA: outer membrane beta-barrel protein [Pseudolabrys sp.]|nr:outer membrane beta-barrel protein [Pseudolabrys sp.]
MGTKLATLVAALVGLGATQLAWAADMPVKAPITKAPAAVAPAWTGFYVNGGFGYGMWTADTTTIDPATGLCNLCVTQTQGGKGWLGVVGLGYDYQFAQSFVAGVFGDFNFGDIKGTIQDQDPFFAGDTKERSAWAVGARLGWLVTPDLLAYVNGGYTSARFSGATMVNTHGNVPPTGFSTPGATFHGWFIGAGTESTVPSILGLQLGPGWFWRNEYRYASYRNKTLSDTTATGVADDSINFKPTVQTITTEIVYKLNTGGPVYQAPAPVAPINWTGFYVNGGIGYGFWAADTTTFDNTTGICVLCVVQKQGGKGWLGVAGAGFDYQLTPKIVAGVFGDYDLSSLKGTIQDQEPFFAGDIKQKSAWALGGRAGWLITPQLLTYVNGGFTSARFSGASMVNTHGNQPPTGFSTPATTFDGWFLGSGVEAALTPNLFWRTEYRFARYSNEALPDTNAAGAAAQSINFKPTVQTATTQLVYKFGWLR